MTLRHAAWIALAASTACGTARAQSFAEFVARLHSMPNQERPAMVDSFLKSVRSFPLVEHDTLVHFLWRGDAGGVTVPGDANGWDGTAFPMQRVAGTTLWYVTKSFESDARLDYKFTVDGAWILDPRNTGTCTGGYGPNSELRMPAYRAHPELDERPWIPHGRLLDTTITSAELANSRPVRVYLPPRYDSSASAYPVMLVHDGPEYLTLGSMNVVLDNLIADGRIAPVVCVFVPPVNRTAEYAGKSIAAFGRFLVDDVTAWVDRRFRTLAGPSNHATMGASNGGNISLHLATVYPQVFGKAAAQSSYIMPEINAAVRRSPALPIRVYLDLGTYDITQLIPLVRSFAEQLAAGNYEYVFREHHEGHSWCNWRARIAAILEYFFPASPATTDPPAAPAQPELGQNYPNPFDDRTTIPFTLPAAGGATLRIRDALGRDVHVESWAMLDAGPHASAWIPAAAPAGVYSCELSYRDAVRSIRIARVR